MRQHTATICPSRENVNGLPDCLPKKSFINTVLNTDLSEVPDVQSYGYRLVEAALLVSAAQAHLLEKECKVLFSDYLPPESAVLARPRQSK